MTEDEVHALLVMVDLPTAARAFGLGRNTAYELVRSGAGRPQCSGWGG